jgi:hypothetical protein
MLPVVTAVRAVQSFVSLLHNSVVFASDACRMCLDVFSSRAFL